jgi:formamidopyrimidine-DNA glycosylase
VGHRGKYLLLQFESVQFAIHLMQGGRLKPDAKQSAKPRGGLARWVFDDGTALLLTEAGTEKKAGVWVLAIDADLSVDTVVEPFVGLGPDADRVDLDQLRTLLAAHSMRLHGFLRDQRILAGLADACLLRYCRRSRASKLGAESARLSGPRLVREVPGHEPGDDLSSKERRGRAPPQREPRSVRRPLSSASHATPARRTDRRQVSPMHHEQVPEVPGPAAIRPVTRPTG